MAGMRNKIIVLTVFILLIGSVEASVVIPFSSPENSFSAVSSYLEKLDKSVYISAYTFGSREFAGSLIEAKRRGVDVKIIVENSPVGEKIDKDFLCVLVNNGLDVYLYEGGLNFLHAKYIIGDNRSLIVTSENFVDDGFHTNRGWGVVVEDPKLAKEALDVYLSDFRESEKIFCENKDSGLDFQKTNKEELKWHEGQRVQVVIAPDAVQDILELLDSAKKSIYIEQFYIYKNWASGKNLFLEKAIEKARDGVDVKIILDSNYYNLDKKDPNSNYYTLEYIKNNILTEKIPVEAKLADLEGLGFSKIHAKGVIVDNSSFLVSSINWNENSPRKNREIGVIVSGDSVKYFLEKFVSDWDSQNTGLGSGRLIEKYNNTILQIVLFIIVVGLVMFLVKRSLKRKSHVSI